MFLKGIIKNYRENLMEFYRAIYYSRNADQLFCIAHRVKKLRMLGIIFKLLMGHIFNPVHNSKFV